MWSQEAAHASGNEIAGAADTDLQAHEPALGSTNTKPEEVGVSAKSIVTPRSSAALADDRKILSPLTLKTSSPATADASTLNCELMPEQPPGLTVRRNPAWSPSPLKRTMRRIYCSAAGVTIGLV